MLIFLLPGQAALKFKPPLLRLLATPPLQLPQQPPPKLLPPHSLLPSPPNLRLLYRSSKQNVLIFINSAQNSLAGAVGVDFYLLNNGNEQLTSFDLRYVVVSPFISIVYRYMGISDTLPFHLNPVGNLGQPMGSLTTYGTTTIPVLTNYTTLATGKGYAYKTFNASFSNYRFIFFLTCFQYAGEIQSGTPFPPNVNFTLTIVNINQFRLDIIVGQNFKTKYIHATILIMDFVQISANPKYKLTYDRIILSGRTGGEIIIPQGY